MSKLLIPIALALAVCACSSNLADTANHSALDLASVPAGLTIVEESPEGYFIRLSSKERVSSAMIMLLSDSLSSRFERIDLCLDDAHERDDVYISINDGNVFDYENNLVYPLITMPR